MNPVDVLHRTEKFVPDAISSKHTLTHARFPRTAAATMEALGGGAGKRRFRATAEADGLPLHGCSFAHNSVNV